MNHQVDWSRRGRRALIAMVASALALVVSVGTAQAQPSAAGTTSNADIEKSILFERITWSGYIYYQAQTGYQWSEQVEATAYCSGFFVSGSGHIATAGHCVDPAEGKGSLIETFLNDQVSQGLLTSADAEALLPEAMANWRVEGDTQGAEPVRTVEVVQPSKVEDASVTSWLTVQVLDFRPFSGGDVALLKGEVSDSQPLPVATEDPGPGTDVTSIGYPFSVTQAVDEENLEATFASGTVSGRQTIEGASRTQVNADIGGGMSGGPSVDELGNVLGVNSSSVVNDQNFNFITDTTDFLEWVKSHGVDPVAPNAAQQNGSTQRSTSTESAESDGLPVWVWLLIGAGGVLVIAGVVLPLALRRSKRTATQYPAQQHPVQQQPVAPYPPQPPAPVGAATADTQSDEDAAARAEYERLRSRFESNDGR
jgi:S1-C subfamily serine protease